MITSDQSTELKKILGSRDVAATVLQRLEIKGVTTKKGTPYDFTMVSKVLNGKREQLDIENILLDMYDEKIKDIQERNNRLAIINAS